MHLVVAQEKPRSAAPIGLRSGSYMPFLWGFAYLYFHFLLFIMQLQAAPQEFHIFLKHGPHFGVVIRIQCISQKLSAVPEYMQIPTEGAAGSGIWASPNLGCKTVAQCASAEYVQVASSGQVLHCA